MAKKPRPRVQGKVQGTKFYPWEASAMGRKGNLARPRQALLAQTVAGRAAQMAAARLRKANGEFRRVVFHISLTGDYPTRLFETADRGDGNCSAVVRRALDFYWEQEGG